MRLPTTPTGQKGRHHKPCPAKRWLRWWWKP